VQEAGKRPTTAHGRHMTAIRSAIAALTIMGAAAYLAALCDTARRFMPAGFSYQFSCLSGLRYQRPRFMTELLSLLSTLLIDPPMSLGFCPMRGSDGYRLVFE
jgi:hypothetical protein